jgi:hypothetical protein
MFVPDPGSEFFPSRIQGQTDSRIRIRIKEFKYLTQKIVFKLSEIWSKMFIPDPDPKSRGQKGTESATQAKPIGTGT